MSLFPPAIFFGTSFSGKTELNQRARRKPRLLLRFDGVLLFRFDTRQFLALLFQLPPRFTRLEPVMDMRHYVGPRFGVAACDDCRATARLNDKPFVARSTNAPRHTARVEASRSSISPTVYASLRRRILER